MAERTTVVSVRGRDRKELMGDPLFCYVGRGMPKAGWAASIWGNPFRVDATHSAEQAVLNYQSYLITNPGLMSCLHELQGKKLGCWCGSWRPGDAEFLCCHAVVLARLADALMVGRPAGTTDRGGPTT